MPSEEKRVDRAFRSIAKATRLLWLSGASTRSSEQSRLAEEAQLLRSNLQNATTHQNSPCSAWLGVFRASEHEQHGKRATRPGLTAHGSAVGQLVSHDPCVL
mmetsp:Transcript_24542/g.62601  ORF Transcript_24542/g.62601 Transcript_24542/m.62601 type:complete len:102 (+) Transcript_24542:585-890(+)